MWWGLFYQVWNHIGLGEDTQTCVALVTYFKIGFCLVTKLCPTLCDPMDCSTPDFPVLCYLPDFAQTHAHWAGDAIRLSHPFHPLLLLPSIFPNIRVFCNESALHSGGQSIGALAPVLPMNIQGLFPLGLTGLISWLSKGISRVFSNTTVQNHQFFSTQPYLWSIHDYWKNHSFD